jgi:DNA polymerase III epsilon subunit-like protein
MDSTEWSDENDILLIELIKNATSFDMLPLFLNRDETFIRERIKIIYNRIKSECKVKHADLKMYIGDNTSALELIPIAITGKRVLILDFETTGLISDQKLFYQYTNNGLYDSCRVIEIGYYYSQNFNNDIDTLEIHNYLRKPTDFTSIDPRAEQVHGISFEKITNEGIEFKTLLNNKLLYILNNIDVLVSHNIRFDFYVLLNELYRLKQWKTIHRLLTLRKNNCVLCTCQASGYKKLSRLYQDTFNIEPENAHRASDDVKILIEILLKKRYESDKYRVIAI